MADPKPVGVNLFSVRRQLIQDFEGTLERIARMGYAGVEPMVFGPIPLDVLPGDMRVPTPDGETLRRLLDGLGLQTTSLHAPRLSTNGWWRSSTSTGPPWRVATRSPRSKRSARACAAST